MTLASIANTESDRYDTLLRELIELKIEIARLKNKTTVHKHDDSFWCDSCGGGMDDVRDFCPNCGTKILWD